MVNGIIIIIIDCVGKDDGSSSTTIVFDPFYHIVKNKRSEATRKNEMIHFSNDDDLNLLSS